jgi:hypothetical protein
MTATWSPHELQCIEKARELNIAARCADGTLRRWTPIWVVCADDQVYVRTWYRRDTGWFGHALRSHRARVRVPGLEADVTVEDVGEGPAEIGESVDTAYRTKYGSAGSESMVTASAAATTLRLNPEREAQSLARDHSLSNQLSDNRPEPW